MVAELGCSSEFDHRSEHKKSCTRQERKRKFSCQVGQKFPFWVHEEHEEQLVAGSGFRKVRAEFDVECLQYSATNVREAGTTREATDNLKDNGEKPEFGRRLDDSPRGVTMNSASVRAVQTAAGGSHHSSRHSFRDR